MFRFPDELVSLYVDGNGPVGSTTELFYNHQFKMQVSSTEKTSIQVGDWLKRYSIYEFEVRETLWQRVS